MVDQSINARPSKPCDSILYLYPDDVVEYHNRFRKNGLDVPELTVTFYGLTEFRINDLEVNRRWIGQETLPDSFNLRNGTVGINPTVPSIGGVIRRITASSSRLGVPTAP